MSLTFKQFLLEAPIGDYQTFGDFSKNSSFRDRRDRFLIKNPKTIELVKKKFDNTEHMFNFYFVNSAKANKHTEDGLITLQALRDKLGDEVADTVADKLDNDSINIVFTNNKGSERMPLTSWMMAHRIMHAMARENGMYKSYAYTEASDALLDCVSDCLQYYGVQDTVTKDRHMSSKNRKFQLIMLQFFYQVATFKSARDKNIRDWFEILNELGAQYLTTGKIKFNQAPNIIELKGPKGFIYRCSDLEAVNDLLNSLENTMMYYIDIIMSNACNRIYLM